MAFFVAGLRTLPLNKPALGPDVVSVSFKPFVPVTLPLLPNSNPLVMLGAKFPFCNTTTPLLQSKSGV